MKKIRKIFISCIVLIICAIVFVACGKQGADGINGIDGTNGKSAYEIWLDNGHAGSEADFLEWLKGASENIGKLDGSGTQTNPYTICTKEQLIFVANQVNQKGVTYADVNLELKCNIDLGGTEWMPIGIMKDRKFFAGNFNGNGFKISNFKITEEFYYAGLFGYNVGTIKNLGITDFEIDVFSFYSQFGPYVGGLVGYNDGIITNCYATGDISATIVYSINQTVAPSATVGGLVGRGGVDSNISNSFATGNVAIWGGEHAFAGGFMGGNNGQATNCFAIGNISASAATNISTMPIVGTSFVGSSITNCYWYDGQEYCQKRKTGETTGFFNPALSYGGTVRSLEQLNNRDFYLDDLGWNISIWTFSNLDFANGKYPTLNN